MNLFLGGALADREVGDEYLRINSLTPNLSGFIENNASSNSFPGAKNITVES